MAKIKTFEKILDIKEQEKNKAQQKYQDSITLFEEVATQLYECLKKKEETELSIEKTLQNNMTIASITSKKLYIESLDSKIKELQEQVQKKRKSMEQKQTLLTEAYIEVKKFEKMIETKKRKANEIELEADKKQMDDLSIRQFLNQGK